MLNKSILWIGALLCIGVSLIENRAFSDTHVEIQYSHSDLTQGFSSWNDVNVIGSVQLGPGSPWILEADSKNHFNENGLVFGLTKTQVYREDWYQDFSASTSTNGHILPVWVLFSEIHHKVLSDLSLIPGLGVSYTKGEDPYSDRAAVIDLAYYFSNGMFIQPGFRLNSSAPGSVLTTRVFLILSTTKLNRWVFTTRLEFGKEGYTVLGADQFQNKFKSTLEMLDARYSLTALFGVQAQAEFYQSPVYHRTTGLIGLFCDF